MDKQTLLQTLRSQGITNPRVLGAIKKVPREQFVTDDYLSRAWDNTALPITDEQTISQPYVVALMTQAIIEISPKKILEIGTGSGYQCAILAELFDEVYSIERIENLMKHAQQVLTQLPYQNIHLKHDNGINGWPEHAPFDAIIVTAASDDIPAPLIEQLGDPGRMVIPVGPHGHQQLMIIDKIDGKLHPQSIELVSFVPLVNKP